MKYKELDMAWIGNTSNNIGWGSSYLPKPTTQQDEIIGSDEE